LSIEKRPNSAIDLATLSAHFDASRAEEYWDKQWAEWKLYDYDDTRSREETFVVDTPPPTVSGSLHIGHVFSYTQTDVIVRYQRMCGRNIFYPMGWDDNGLPTERRVQNYFHVRCDPRVPYDRKLEIEILSAKEQKERSPRIISRDNFIELCLRLTREDELAFMALWRRIGLSLDWRQEYSTIDERCRRLAQLSFIDLYQKGYIYHVESPMMWDVDFQTAIAQAEVEDRKVSSALHHIRFGSENSDRSFIIATSRPELLPACVGVTAHPGDARYQGLFGKRAITPLFRTPVPIFPSELADPEKGTGILMVCTFGDATDVSWWREHNLPLRQIIGRDGKLMPVSFGENNWPSLDPEAANDFYRELAGKTVSTARKIIVEMLGQPTGAAVGKDPPLTEEPKPIEHPVKFFEKGDKPLEFITTKQWFVRLLDKIDRLIEAGDQITWHPDFMRIRYRNWTENLQLDWCISRQRFFGVPFPVWFALDEQGIPDLSRPLIASADRIPVDPMNAPPKGFDETQRDRPNGFTAETDVFDTWFTSSLTPQICTHWQLDQERHRKLFPTDLRPQSHEIIRTWAFYTIVKSLLHEDTIPWKNVAISGWVLDPDRKKMSKSKGNVMTPMHLIDEYSADAVRYWTAIARLGVDTAFDEKVLKVGKRLVTKLFNASKFVLTQTGEQRAITCELDLAFLQKLGDLVKRLGELHDRFDYATALKETESFFWKSFTDTYIEMVKARARGEGTDDNGRGSAVATLRRGLNVLLRLFAPVLPYVTEEVWSWGFAEQTGIKSIHIAAWPTDAEFDGLKYPKTPGVFDMAISCLTVINRSKSEAGVSTGRPFEHLAIAMNSATAVRLKGIISDVMAAVRAKSCQIEVREDLADDIFQVVEARFIVDLENQTPYR
jgi:valyl-tRNA synthetase